MKLEDACELIIDAEHKTAPFQKEGYPNIRTPNIGKGRLILEGVFRVSEETYRLWTKRAIPQPNDLILAREAPVGNVAIVPKNELVCLGQRTVLLRPDIQKVNPQFLCYFLLGDEMQNSMLGKSGGSTVAHLNMKDIRALELGELPPLPTQQKIASILSAYDDLIENNLRRIKLLEEAAQHLYREWFVRFRFPGHETVKMVEGLPEGWERKRLGEFCFVNQATISEKKAPDTIHYIDISSTNTGCFERPNEILFKDAPSRARRIVKHGDTIFSTVRPNRKTYALILEPFENLVASTGFAVLTPKRIEDFPFVYLSVSSQDFVDKVSMVATGAAYPAVNQSDFEKMEIVVPPEKLRLVAFKIFEPFFLQKENLLYFTRPPEVKNQAAASF